jgi:antirestriction protein ArdC
MKGKFGSADYAEEELVAELGSAFLMADLGFMERYNMKAILLPG